MANDHDYPINSRFFALETEHGEPRLRHVTEAQVSAAIDMADCNDDTARYVYLNHDGQLVPITIGRQHSTNADQDAPIVYASAAMIAAGKVVGFVDYTDH